MCVWGGGVTPSDAGACCLMSCCRRMRVPAVRATCAAALSEVEAGIRARAAAASFPSSSAAVGLQCGQHEMRRAKASRECAKPGQHVRDGRRMGMGPDAMRAKRKTRTPTLSVRQARRRPIVLRSD